MTVENKSGLQVTDLECMRDDRVLFEAVSFTLQPGEAMVVEGANGCGKTTLLRTLCGLVSQEQGLITWNGEAIEQARDQFHQEMVFLAHNNGLKDDLTPIENLRTSLALAGRVDSVDYDELLAGVGLAGYEDVTVKRFSAGMKRRVALARIKASDAALWVMDEPFTSLDKAGMELCELFIEQHCAQGGMAVLSSHHDISLSCKQLHALHLKP